MMILPLNNASHSLYGKDFTQQCNLIINAQDIYDLFGLFYPADQCDVDEVYQHLTEHFQPERHKECEKALAAQAMEKIRSFKEWLERHSNIEITPPLAPNKSEIRDQRIKEGLKKDPSCYSYLSPKDKMNLEYIILAFMHHTGRIQKNIDHLPLKHLSIKFIKALTIVWPDLENKLSVKMQESKLVKNTTFTEIKNSLPYNTGKPKQIKDLLILSAGIIVMAALLYLTASIFAIPLVIIAGGALLALTYNLYQWNATRMQVNKIRFFQAPSALTQEEIPVPADAPSSS
jgi:hypothetical protein